MRPNGLVGESVGTVLDDAHDAEEKFEQSVLDVDGEEI